MANYELLGLNESTPKAVAPTSGDVGTVTNLSVLSGAFFGDGSANTPTSGFVAEYIGEIRVADVKGGAGLEFGYSDGTGVGYLQTYNRNTPGFAPILINNGLTVNASGHAIQALPASAPALSTNSTMTFELTSNTSLKISVRGTDGTTRSVSLTLS